MVEEDIAVKGIRFSSNKDGVEVGHAYLYLLHNDLHDKPFGLLEDVYVNPSYRGNGVARELLDAVISRAGELCYKLIATSRNDGTRDAVHEWYIRLGFECYGTEFRTNFS